MPIYEYLCPNCNGRFQKLVQGFSDPAGLACPRCGNAQVRRAIERDIDRVFKILADMRFEPPARGKHGGEK